MRGQERTWVREPIAFVTGRNPLGAMGGGSSYVRAHARAASAAGFEPHVFCIGDREKVEEADFGYVHSRRAPVPTRKGTSLLSEWLGSFVLSPYMAIAYVRTLADGVEAFLRGGRAPHRVHGFSTWGCVGVEVKRRMRDRAVFALTSLYTTAEHEIRAKIRGARSSGLGAAAAMARLELCWVRAAGGRSEGRAYRGSDVVLVNYESVRRLFEERWGSRLEVRKIPYTIESAFLAADRRSPVPREIETLEPREAPLIVCVSRHDPRKGIDRLLHALAAVKESGFPFRAVLVGGGPLIEPNRRLASRLGLGGETVMTGWVASPQPYLQRADIFVLPSIQEGSGSISLLEALKEGLP